MRRLNDKGFAITGILYSLLVMFLCILAFVLSGLRSNRTMLERSFVYFRDMYSGKLRNDLIDIINDDPNRTVPVSGKYVFILHSGNYDKECVSYLNRGDAINQYIDFIPNDCNLYSYVYSFESEGNEVNVMELKEIYSFEGDN